MNPALCIDRARFPYPTRATVTTIPGGLAGTRATLAAMERHVKAAKLDPRIRRVALCIVRGLPSQTFAGDAYAGAIHDWVGQNIQFVRDVDGVETITPPAWLLATRAGDCDDHVMLVAALMLAVGIPVRWVVGGWKPNEPEHVWSEVLVDGEWIAADTTRSVGLGDAPPYPFRIVEWEP